MDIWQNPRPWMVSESVDYLETVITPEDLCLEFGGGASSIWWAERCKYTYTVEASPTWAPKIIEEMRQRPAALAKWSMLFAPCEWHTSFERPKPFWKHPAREMRQEHAAQLEKAYLNENVPFSPTVIVVDGSVRPQSIVVADAIARRNRDVRVIVVDNSDTLRTALSGRFEGFEQTVFEETDGSKIPEHQHGVWHTTVYERGH